MICILPRIVRKTDYGTYLHLVLTFLLMHANDLSMSQFSGVATPETAIMVTAM